MYSLFWRSPALPFIGKQTPISVPAGSVVSNAASLRLTGKGATNYGKIQQENLLRLLENFAGGTEPDFPTVGQIWYDTTTGLLKVCTNTAPGPIVWEQLNSTQATPIGSLPPSPATLGDTWFSQTGSASGILYVYTGIGRYPQIDWNATSSGYWPPAATTTLRVILNSQVFGAAGTSFGNMYVHGTTASVSANVAGSISLNTVTTVIPAGAVKTKYAVTDGLIVVDGSGTFVSATSGHTYFVVRQFDNGDWFYDNSSVLVKFTPSNLMFVIGTCTITEGVDNLIPGTPNAPPNVTSATMWTNAISMTNITQAPGVLAAGAIGGWEQIWPTVEVAGGRLEYDYLYGELAKLIGNPIAYGGSGAEGKSIQSLTNFRVLDASLQRAFTLLAPDTNVLGGGAITSLRTVPNSQDWSALLSACRYAIKRIDLPVDSFLSVAQYPFVQDNLPGKPIQSYNSTNALNSDLTNKTRVGLITLISQHQETVNVTRSANAIRYAARAITANSNPSTNTALSIANQALYSVPGASIVSTTTTHGLAYEFNKHSNLEAFFFSGGAIEVVMSYTVIGVPTTFDTALQNIVANGRIRLTADKTYVMTSGTASTSVLSRAPITTGVKDLTSSPALLATLFSGGSSVFVSAVRESDSTVALLLAINPGPALTGTFSATWTYIKDVEQYNNPTPVNVYPSPILNVTAVHRRGSTLFV